MASEIDVQDAELLALMEQLEAETGVPSAAAAAPVATPAPSAPVAAAPVAAALVEATTPAAKTNEDAELLAALEGLQETGATLSAGPVTAPLPDDELAAALEATPAAAAPVTAPVAAASPDDELAQLEAELAAQSATAAPAVQVQPVKVTVDPGTGAATAELVAATVRKEVEAAAAPTPATGGKAALQAHLEGLDFFVDPKQFNVDTRVSDVELDRNMVEQNSLRAYYGAQSAQAEAQAARMKLKFEIAEAKLYDEHRRILLEAGEKVTEKMVEVEVKKDPRWGKIKSLVIDADTIAGINRALVDSLRDRKDMLVQLGADRRGEINGQRSTMAATEHRQSEAQRAADVARAALNR